MKRRRAPVLPAFRADLLELVNRVDRSPDPLAVAEAALRLDAFTRNPVPDYRAALSAERAADVVLAALYRRGMLT